MRGGLSASRQRSTSVSVGSRYTSQHLPSVGHHLCGAGTPFKSECVSPVEIKLSSRWQSGVPYGVTAALKRPSAVTAHVIPSISLSPAEAEIALPYNRPHSEKTKSQCPPLSLRPGLSKASLVKSCQLGPWGSRSYGIEK